jgi:DNA-binding MarR family transcriptional regulator
MRQDAAGTGAVEPSRTAVLIVTARKAAAAVDRALAAEDVTVEDWLVLEALAGIVELPMAQVRAVTLTSAPTLSRVVDRLVSRALVFREVDAADRRKVRIGLSKRGVVLHRRLAAAVHATEQQWLDSDGQAAIVGAIERDGALPNPA